MNKSPKTPPRCACTFVSAPCFEPVKREGGICEWCRVACVNPKTEALATEKSA